MKLLTLGGGMKSGSGRGRRFDLGPSSSFASSCTGGRTKTQCGEAFVSMHENEDNEKVYDGHGHFFE